MGIGEDTKAIEVLEFPSGSASGFRWSERSSRVQSLKPKMDGVSAELEEETGFTFTHAIVDGSDDFLA